MYVSMPNYINSCFKIWILLALNLKLCVHHSNQYLCVVSCDHMYITHAFISVCLDSLEPFADKICPVINVKEILPSMIACGLVTRSDQEYFLNEHHTPGDKQLKMTCLILSLTEKSVELFIKCLSQTADNCAAHGELLETLRKGK